MEIEFNVDGKNNEFDMHYVKAQNARRNDWLTIWCLKNASEREKRIWNELINSFKED